MRILTALFILCSLTGFSQDQKAQGILDKLSTKIKGLKSFYIEEKSVYESDANDSDEESVNPKKLMTIWETGFKNQYVKEEKLNNEAVHVINLYPKNAAKADYHTITLYISKASVELKKAIMKAKNGTTMTYSLSKFTQNPTVEDTKFVFDLKKYPGYTVVKD